MLKPLLALPLRGTCIESFRKDISVLSAARTSGTATICKVCALDTLQPHRFLPIGIEYVFQAYSRA